MSGENTAVREYLDRLMEKLRAWDSGITPESLNAYRTWLESLNALNEKTGNLYRRDSRTGDHLPMNEAVYEDLMTAYRDALDEGRKFLDTAGGSDGTRSEIVRRINGLLSSDLALLNTLAPLAGRSVKLPDAIRQARSYVMDYSGSAFGSVSGALSSRIPITVLNDSGEPIEGFFTPDKSFDPVPEFRRMLQERYDLLVAGNGGADAPESQETAAALQPFRQLLQCTDPMLLKQMADLNTTARCIARDLKPEDMSPYQLFLTENKGFFNQFDILTNVNGLRPGDIVAHRNCAMSAVADLLGVPHLVAHSRTMTISRNEHVYRGVFMEKARGKDLARLDENDPIYTNDPAKQDNASLKRCLADLQVLDYLCGNGDRHSGNMLYLTDNDNNVVGVQGIDNDTSFGPRVPDNNRNMGMRGSVRLSDMMVISRPMANRIRNLTPQALETVLRGYDFPSEVLTAARLRLSRLKRAIEIGRTHFLVETEDNKLLEAWEGSGLLVMDEGDWDRISLEALAFQGEGAPKPDSTGQAKPKYLNQFRRLYQLKSFAKAAKKDAERYRADLTARPQNYTHAVPLGNHAHATEAAFVKEQLKTEAGIDFTDGLLLSLRKVDSPDVRSSREFKAMVRSLEDLKKFLTVDIYRKPEEAAAQYRARLDAAHKATQTYVKKKESEWFPSDLAMKRTDAARYVDESLTSHLMEISGRLESYTHDYRSTFAELVNRENAERHQDTMGRELRLAQLYQSAHNRLKDELPSREKDPLAKLGQEALLGCTTLFTLAASDTDLTPEQQAQAARAIAVITTFEVAATDGLQALGKYSTPRGLRQFVQDAAGRKSVTRYTGSPEAIAKYLEDLADRKPTREDDSRSRENERRPREDVTSDPLIFHIT